MLMSVIVLPVSAVETENEERAVVGEFVHIIHDEGFCTTDPRDILVSLFGIDKTDIKETSADADSRWGAEKHTFKTYYYDFDNNSHDLAEADIEMYSAIENRFYTDESRDEFFPEGSSSIGVEMAYAGINLKINKSALPHLCDEFSSFIGNISTPRSLYEYCGDDVPPQYYDYTPSKYFKEYNTIYAYIGNSNDDVLNKNSPCIGDYIAFLTPTSAILHRGVVIDNWIRYLSRDEVYGQSFFSGITEYFMMVNYAAPEEGSGVDLLDSEIDSITLKMEYEVYRDSHWPDYAPNYTAPQTGISTALLAVAALVSGAYVVKKRRR